MRVFMPRHESPNKTVQAPATAPVSSMPPQPGLRRRQVIQTRGNKSSATANLKPWSHVSTYHLRFKCFHSKLDWRQQFSAW